MTEIDEFDNDGFADPDNSLLDLDLNEKKLTDEDQREIGLLMQDFPPEDRGDYE